MPEIEYELLQVSEKEMMTNIITSQISVGHPCYFCITSAGTVRIYPPLDPATMALRFTYKGKR